MSVRGKAEPGHRTGTPLLTIWLVSLAHTVWQKLLFGSFVSFGTPDRKHLVRRLNRMHALFVESCVRAVCSHWASWATCHRLLYSWFAFCEIIQMSTKTSRVSQCDVSQDTWQKYQNSKFQPKQQVSLFPGLYLDPTFAISPPLILSWTGIWASIHTAKPFIIETRN